MPRTLALLLTTAAAVTVAVTPAFAQVKASEAASVTQTVDGTTLRIEYSRPSLRDRSGVFGSQVAYDTLWTPGANNATTLTVNRDILLLGRVVPAGTWSLWMAVRDGDWDLVLDPRDRMFHTDHPARSDSQLVFTVRPDTTAALRETLLWSFETVRRTGTDLRFHWDRTVVDLPIEVQPSRVLTMTAEQAGPYVGVWRAEGTLPDSSATAWGFDLELTHENGFLGGMMSFGPGMPSELMILAPKADQVFTPVYTVNGTVGEPIDDAYFEFTFGSDGRAETLEVRFGPEDTLWMSARRVRDP